jgi:hypothetical protein
VTSGSRTSSVRRQDQYRRERHSRSVSGMFREGRLAEHRPQDAHWGCKQQRQRDEESREQSDDALL